MNISEELHDDNSLDFYVKFTRLTAEDFGRLLLSSSEIYNAILDLYTRDTGILIGDRPSLEIVKVHTGDSIKFCLNEGWLPKVYSDKENDIIISTPKKLGIPLLIAWLLLCSAEKILDVNNKHLDGQIKELELRLKQEEINKLKEKSDSKAFLELKNKSDGLIQAFLKNDSFDEITINNALIKSSPSPKDKKNNHIEYK
jgi:hypothetical protein